MATHLYETLGLSSNASPEDVRKAYRKRALQTHPDRLAPGVSAAEKASAEEQFRKVNNAYEVLNDPQNRTLYDQHGVWPPPQPEPQRRRSTSSQQQTFDPFMSDPFFNTPFGTARSFAFTDPFQLFNSLFGDLNRHFDDNAIFADPFPSMSPFGSRSAMADPFGGSMMPFGSSFGSLTGFPDMMNMSSGSRSYTSVTRAMGQDGQWVSRSEMTRTINGRTEKITKRRDAQGNEYVTYSSADGERTTINGIEQPPRSHASLPPPPRNAQPSAIRSSTMPAVDQYTAPPPQPVYNNAPLITMHNAAPTQAPPSYTSHPSQEHVSRHSSRSSSHHHSRHSDAHQPMDIDNEHDRPSGHRHWWRGGEW